MYCTVAEIREVAVQITATGQPGPWTDAIVEKLIERASRIFDHECGVPDEYFEASDNSVSERTIYGDGTNFLKLPPYVPGSLNTSLTYPDGYSALEFAERGGYLVRTESGILNAYLMGGWYENVPITVSAKWGFVKTPADVNAAIIEFVINIIRETDPAHLKLVNIDGQPLRERMPPRVASVAKYYRLNTGVMV